MEQLSNGNRETLEKRLGNPWCGKFIGLQKIKRISVVAVTCEWRIVTENKVYIGRRIWNIWQFLSPQVFDYRKDGIHCERQSSAVRLFELNGTGKAVQIQERAWTMAWEHAWIRKQNKWLREGYMAGDILNSFCRDMLEVVVGNNPSKWKWFCIYFQWTKFTENPMKVSCAANAAVCACQAGSVHLASGEAFIKRWSEQ